MRTSNKKLDRFFLVVIVLILVGLPFGISFYDKYAALAPVDKPVPQDGQKAQIVIDTFWEVGRQQKQIHNAIDINVGN